MNNVLLNAIDGKTKRTFAFPCGDLTIGDTPFYNGLRRDFVAARGVRSAMDPIGKVDLDNIDCYGINGQTAEQMIDLVKKAMASHTLLVFLFHGVGGGHSLNVGLNEHSQLLHYLKEHEREIWVAPMVEVAEYVRTNAAIAGPSPAAIRDWPKVELHLHLDCSLSYEVVKKIDPSISPEAYRAGFIAPARCTNLADYIARAIKAVDLMQTKEQLRLATLDLFDQLQKDHVIYAEIRYAPLLHLKKGLTPEQVVAAVNDAVSEGIAKTGIQVGVLLCTLRHYTAEQSMETVRLVEQFKGTHIVGFDIAGDEAGYPITNHIAAFEYARAKHISCTAHAGEAAGPQSVRETLEHFHPSRIGHGVRSFEDSNVVALVKQQRILLEVCPTSNLQTNIYDQMKDHPVDKLHRSGVSLNINTDCRTISNTTLDNEYQRVEDVFHWTKADFLACNLDAVDHAFTSEENKKMLREMLIKGYGAARATSK
jgi:adenosine deaminase